jgi:AcrR family transcriptional regulator
VRDATVDTTAALVAKHGLAGVTMSQIAKETGIGGLPRRAELKVTRAGRLAD